jgi:hypothetical protein
VLLLIRNRSQVGRQTLLADFHDLDRRGLGLLAEDVEITIASGATW